MCIYIFSKYIRNFPPNNTVVYNTRSDVPELDVTCAMGCQISCIILSELPSVWPSKRGGASVSAMMSRQIDATIYLLTSFSYWSITTGELKWSGGWSTGTVGWLSTSERGQYLVGWPAMNTKCMVPLPFLPDLILCSAENRSHGSPVLVQPETQ